MGSDRCEIRCGGVAEGDSMDEEADTKCCAVQADLHFHRIMNCVRAIVVALPLHSGPRCHARLSAHANSGAMQIKFKSRRSSSHSCMQRGAATSNHPDPPCIGRRIASGGAVVGRPELGSEKRNAAHAFTSWDDMIDKRNKR
jgi:hypothetical protein